MIKKWIHKLLLRFGYAPVISPYHIDNFEIHRREIKIDRYVLSHIVEKEQIPFTNAHLLHSEMRQELTKRLADLFTFEEHKTPQGDSKIECSIWIGIMK